MSTCKSSAFDKKKSKKAVYMSGRSQLINRGVLKDFITITHIWNWFCGMAFRAAVVLLLMPSMLLKCLHLNISFTFGNRKKSLGARSGE
jgi:hypothetical protein